MWPLPAPAVPSRPAAQPEPRPCPALPFMPVPRHCPVPQTTPFMGTELSVKEPPDWAPTEGWETLGSCENLGQVFRRHLPSLSHWGDALGPPMDRLSVLKSFCSSPDPPPSQPVSGLLQQLPRLRQLPVQARGQGEAGHSRVVQPTAPQASCSLLPPRVQQRPARPALPSRFLSLSLFLQFGLRVKAFHSLTIM